MTDIIKQQLLTGERALFKARDKEIRLSTFADGESPLKESRDIRLFNSSFKWKYPLWYSRNIELKDCTLFKEARAGIWYTDDLTMNDCIVEAPKTFRRCRNLVLNSVSMVNAEETLWHCQNVTINRGSAKGNYFAMNSSDLKISDFELIGNYSFDGAKNIVIDNARMLSKDSFWNAENVEVRNSFISGEYIGWNSRNIRFFNCIIESLQGFCYIDELTLENCNLINTNLAFEYSTVYADVNTIIDSIKNPVAGRITAKDIKEIIFDDPERSDPQKTEIIIKK